MCRKDSFRFSCDYFITLVAVWSVLIFPSFNRVRRSKYSVFSNTTGRLPYLPQSVPPVGSFPVQRPPLVLVLRPTHHLAPTLAICLTTALTLCSSVRIDLAVGPVLCGFATTVFILHWFDHPRSSAEDE